MEDGHSARDRRRGSVGPARRRRASKRGVALLMVLGTLAVLTVMLTEFQDATSAELGSSLAARDQVKAEYAARSAVNLTRLLIAAEPTIRASGLGLLVGNAQIPVWEYTDVVLGAFNDALGGETFEAVSGMMLSEGRNLGMDNAGFELKVVDEDSKLNLNMAARADAFSQKRQAEQLLGLIGGLQYSDYFDNAEDEKGNYLDRQTVCGAIIDWIDPDTDMNACDPSNENATSAPAEDSYYQLLDRPFMRKNAAFDSLQELHMVKGVTDKFWRMFIAPDPDDPKARIATVWGSGKVNVNSANPKTLLALVCHLAKPDQPLCVDLAMQQTYLMTSQMFAGMMAGIPLFKSPAEFVKAIKGEGMFGELLQQVQVQPVQLKSDKMMEEAITTESQVFSIYATGFVKAGKRRTTSHIHAVVDMRGAPPPGTADILAKQQQILTQQTDSLKVGDLGSLPDTFEAGGIPSLLLPKPGGSVLYYRVD